MLTKTWMMFTLAFPPPIGVVGASRALISKIAFKLSQPRWRACAVPWQGFAIAAGNFSGSTSGYVSRCRSSCKQPRHCQVSPLLRTEDAHLGRCCRGSGRSFRSGAAKAGFYSHRLWGSSSWRETAKKSRSRYVFLFRLPRQDVGLGGRSAGSARFPAACRAPSAL